MADKPPFRIEVEGLREFNRAVSKADKELAKRLGQVNKEIGEFVISKLEPKSVGEGAGAKVKPSSTRREVLLRVGGSWRAAAPRALQWGKRQEFPGGEPPQRPFIVDTAAMHRAQIEKMLLDGIEQALKPPFY